MATIEIDGKTFNVENGKMIIEVADEAGIYIPRFCYHKKLSIAANCRMCLVEVANSKKPVPACATPIADGMKVYTKSPQAIHSQEAVMEFLLINHPLDCPICDQGGECELQDISMGFGYDSSEYEESKRAVNDDDLGTLISTEMTRCIHCTRCVRFGEEIAGVRELGATGRGEKMQIGTYVQHCMTSEVSGNIIDLCPVGALTSKPSRFKARAWELNQFESIAPHDCLGSNIHLQVRRNELMRVAPHENESINETWLSDRDRFSYAALAHPKRLGQPMIKRAGQWEIVDWETALTFTAESLKRIIENHGPEQLAAFASSSSTLEEYYLLQKMMRELGVNNLDYRLQQTDFRDQHLQATLPTNTLSYKDLEEQQHILILGCNVAREVPLAAIRLRKAHKNGAELFAINAVDYDLHFPLSDKKIISPMEWPIVLGEVLCALYSDRSVLPESLQKLLIGLNPDTFSQRLAQALSQPNAVILTGALLTNHPEAAVLRTMVYWLEKAGVKTLHLTSGANSLGANIAGMLPHRTAGGKSVKNKGLHVKDALNQHLNAYFLLGVEPEYDFANPHRAQHSMLGAEFVVMLSAFKSESMQHYADVILPMAPFAETSGTYVNLDNVWQTVKGAVKPFQEARPAWKILRVLGNLLDCKQFDYFSSDDVLQELKNLTAQVTGYATEPFYPESLPTNKYPISRVGEWPLYRNDMLVRHASPLQHCAASDKAVIRIHPETASTLNLGETATVTQGEIEITLPLIKDLRIAPDVVWVPNAMPETIDLGPAFDSITIKD